MGKNARNRQEHSGRITRPRSGDIAPKGNSALARASRPSTSESLRILWYSNAPFAPTGYGTQTAQVVQRLTKNHEVAIHAMYGIEGVRAAQERFGKGKVMTGEQARWGYENLNLTQAKLDTLGFKGVLRPLSTSCQDHMGSAWTRMHTWDGSKFVWSSDWYQADEQIMKPMVKAAADKYAAEKKIQRRSAADCQL